MAFQLINIFGGVVVPGTAYVELCEEHGQPEYEVVADVFDTALRPDQSIHVAIVRTPYFSIAEWNCELANTGEAPPFDLRAILPGEESHKLAI